MTTPRVTVPVDEQVIKRLQEEADHPGLGDSAMVFGPDLRALLRAYESLSAAPAPEGVTVNADAILEMAAKAVEDHQKIGREWIKGSLWDDLTREASARIRALKADVRAQPQAREDAQPVAWLVGEGGGTIMTRAAAWAAGKRDQGVSVTPLYTHPAPDALRVAVEALEPFAAISGPVSGLADGIEVRFDASFKLQNRDAMCVTRPMVVTVGDIRRAKNALAALQAEQKGGA